MHPIERLTTFLTLEIGMTHVLTKVAHEDTRPLYSALGQKLVGFLVDYPSDKARKVIVMTSVKRGFDIWKESLKEFNLNLVGIHMVLSRSMDHLRSEIPTGSYSGIRLSALASEINRLFHEDMKNNDIKYSMKDLAEFQDQADVVINSYIDFMSEVVNEL